MKRDKNTELVGDIHFNASKEKWELNFWPRDFFGGGVRERKSETKVKYFDSKQEAKNFAENNNINLI